MALIAVGAKVAATSVCLAAGYRGGKIFPLALAGGAVGLGSPVTAALIAAAVVGPALLPLAIVAVVAALVVHVLTGGALAGAALAAGDDPPDLPPGVPTDQR